MKINTMNDNKIELFLSDEEVEKIFGGYELIDYDLPECRIKIHSLLISAAPEGAFPLDCDKVSIEVKPKEFGCTIALTKIYKSSKRYRQVKANKTVIVIFKNSSDLIDALGALIMLRAEESELYSLNSKYAVIAEAKNKSRDIITHLGEFGTVSRQKNDAVRIKEYWQLICGDNAIQKLYDCFK